MTTGLGASFSTTSTKTFQSTTHNIHSGCPSFAHLGRTVLTKSGRTEPERPIADGANRQSIYLPCFIMISKRRVHRGHSSCSLDEKVSIPYNRGRLVYGLFCYLLHYGTSRYRGYWLNVAAYIPRHPRCPIVPSDRAGFADEPRDLQKIC